MAGLVLVITSPVESFTGDVEAWATSVQGNSLAPLWIFILSLGLLVPFSLGLYGELSKGGFAIMRIVGITGAFTTPEREAEVDEFFKMTRRHRRRASSSSPSSASASTSNGSSATWDRPWDVATAAFPSTSMTRCRRLPRSPAQHRSSEPGAPRLTILRLALGAARMRPEQANASPWPRSLLAN